MDRSRSNPLPEGKDMSKVRRTHSIATLRMRGEESSVSSLGSFAEADMVAQQFSPDRLSRQQTIAVDSPSFGASSSRGQRRKQSYNVAGDPSGANQKHCPHCKKQFSNPWAVPKHVLVSYRPFPLCLFSDLCISQSEIIYWLTSYANWQRVHNRSGDFFCPRCTFKTSNQDELLQHEKDFHRKCPYCGQLFVLLNKHIGACTKRPQ